MRAMARSALMLTASVAAAGIALVARGALATAAGALRARSGQELARIHLPAGGREEQGALHALPGDLDFSPDNLAASRLEVTVEMASLDTGDKERDDTLRGADLFAVAKFPQAHFIATQFTKTAAGFEALGKLTIRGVTRDTRVPFTFRTATENGAAVGYMSGKTTLQRLDFGVGQGDWKATDQVGNDVEVSFALRLTGAAAR